MVHSFYVFDFGGAASVARALLRASPGKGSRTRGKHSQTLGMGEQAVHGGVHAQQRDGKPRQADATQ
ncbi:hypothetical protein KSX_59860 [Ktedonospora formicarum]|uniref:Uncharacterized protein n=1 Tax=Ktedonospora formicarum TaxID=2778364 RepID=A0A8J3I8N4_9CHLR|nr:hypothetical protein KSX_59860 [Ktedonospora formicarum]